VLYQTVKERAGASSGRLYILLDEIQDIPGWEKAVNSFLVDFDCDLYLTGSNANLLSSELATHIAGRFVSLEVYPLSFAEYLEFRKVYGTEEMTQEKAFLDFIRFGGLPGLHQLKWDPVFLTQYLQDIFNSILLKDVIDRNGIRNANLLERIVLFLMDNIGNTFSAKTISDFLKNQGRQQSVETVYSYLDALTKALMIYKAFRYDIKGKRWLETQGKYYACDLGLRHALLGFRDADMSGLLENVVYLELRRRGYKVSVGKQDATEVDFIAEKQEEKLYIQVSYLLADKSVLDREMASLRMVDDNFEKWIFTMDPLPDANIEGIRRRSLMEFLLEEVN
jgi:predicted AAA+ superfamily ATPase